jgi:hypothetical protein
VLTGVGLDKTGFDRCLLAGADLTGAHGRIVTPSINVGSPEQPELIEKEAAIIWLRARGGTEVDLFTR